MTPSARTLSSWLCRVPQVFPEVSTVHQHLRRSAEALITQREELKTLTTMYKLGLDANKGRCAAGSALRTDRTADQAIDKN